MIETIVVEDKYERGTVTWTLEPSRTRTVRTSEGLFTTKWPALALASVRLSGFKHDTGLHVAAFARTPSGEPRVMAIDTYVINSPVCLGPAARQLVMRDKMTAAEAFWMSSFGEPYNVDRLVMARPMTAFAYNIATATHVIMGGTRFYLSS